MKKSAGQLQLGLRTWGGRRRGAGAKPKKGRKAGVSHGPRPALSRHHPVHVTLRVRPEVWNLRSRRAFRAIGRVFASCKERDDFRLVHFSVQGNHLHLIVEAADAQRLSRRMQGLATWIARRLNQMMGRRGKVFADRFHAHVLRRPAEAAHAIAYVLGNFAVHAGRWALRVGGALAGAPPARPGSGRVGRDPYSSEGPEGPSLTAFPQTWLLRGALRPARQTLPA